MLGEDTKMPSVNGGCLCGRVRYSGEAEPLRMVACHCKDCQRFTGSAFNPVFAFPNGSISLTGDPKIYTQPGGTSGMPLHRVFCPDCGSSIMMYRDDTGRVNIGARTLDDTEFFKPTANIYCEMKQAWVPLDPEMRDYPTLGE
jgi:hypothetical protein